jgi:hypothetical protein
MKFLLFISAFLWYPIQGEVDPSEVCEESITFPEGPGGSGQHAGVFTVQMAWWQLTATDGDCAPPEGSPCTAAGTVVFAVPPAIQGHTVRVWHVEGGWGGMWFGEDPDHPGWQQLHFTYGLSASCGAEDVAQFELQTEQTDSGGNTFWWPSAKRSVLLSCDPCESSQ